MHKKTIIKKNSRPNPLPIDKNTFEIPEGILTQLDEFTEGGFILIAAPAGGGPPDVISHFDSVTTMYGLHGYAKEYFADCSKRMSQMTDDFLGEGAITC